MFRELTRIKQKLQIDECYIILEKEKRGVLALNGENDYPFAFTMNHYFDKINNKIYFHCGKIGYKFDCLDKNNKACFTLTKDEDKNDNEWWITVKSVIVYGKIEIIDDIEKVVEISDKLSRKFTSDDDYIQKEIDNYAQNTRLLELSIDNICGKIVKEK